MKKRLGEAVSPFITVNTLLSVEIIYVTCSFTKREYHHFILVCTYFEQLLDFKNKFESNQQCSNATNILCYGNTLSVRVCLRNCYVQFHRDINRVNHRRRRCHSRLCKRIVHIHIVIWTVGTHSDRGLKAQGNRDRE